VLRFEPRPSDLQPIGCIYRVWKANFDIFKILSLKLIISRTIHGIKLNFFGINYKNYSFFFIQSNFSSFTGFYFTGLETYPLFLKMGL